MAVGVTFPRGFRAAGTTGGIKASGRGVATDVVEASARAFLGAVNKVVRLRERPDPREVEEVGP